MCIPKETYESIISNIEKGYYLYILCPSDGQGEKAIQSSHPVQQDQSLDLFYLKKIIDYTKKVKVMGNQIPLNMHIHTILN